MSALFVEYEFKKHVSGFYGEFRASKFYDVYSTEQIEKLVNDVTRVLKENRDCMITFQFSGDYRNVDIMRFIGTSSDSFAFIFWKRDENGKHINTFREDSLSNRKNNVRNYVYIGTRTFFELDGK